MKRLEFKLKNQNKLFDEDQRRFLESFIDTPENWIGIKQDFVSLKLIKVTSNSVEIEVEDTGDRWRKHFSKKLVVRGKLDDLCVPYGKGVNKKGYVSRGLFDVNDITT